MLDVDVVIPIVKTETIKRKGGQRETRTDRDKIRCRRVEDYSLRTPNFDSRSE